MSNDLLPPLPEPHLDVMRPGTKWYTADQMREYARAVLAQQFADGERQMLLTALEGIEQTACCNHWLGMNESRRRYAIARDARIAIDRANGLRPYAAPQPARVPLTDEQVFGSDAIMEVNAHAGLPMRWLMELTRAIEAAHGIAAPGAPDAPQSHPQK